MLCNLAKNVCKSDVNIKLMFKPFIRSSLFPTIDFVLCAFTLNIIYQFSCQRCNACNILLNTVF